MKITEGQLRRIIREELLQDATLADVEPELASMQQDYNTMQSHDPQDDPHIYTGQKRHIANRRDTKRLWNKHADLRFFNDPKELFVWHYLGYFSYNKTLSDYFPLAKVKIGAVPGIDLPARDELSCYGKIVSEMKQPPDGGAYFTFKKYRVTFASKVDAETEWISRASPEDVERFKSSGLRKRPHPGIPFTVMPIDRAGAQEALTQRLEEVIIDNWVIDTYHIPSGYWADHEVEHAEKLGLKYEII
jgi:hypothetical protein